MPTLSNAPDVSLDRFSPFPAAELATLSPSEVSREFAARMASEKLPPIDASRLATETETRFAAAKTDIARKRVLYSMCLTLTGQANRALRASGDKRSWHGLVRTGTREAVDSRWVLLDEEQLHAIEAQGAYVRFTRVLQRGLLSLPFAVVFWALALIAYKHGTQTNISIAVAAWILWFAVRTYVRRSNVPARKPSA